MLSQDQIETCRRDGFIVVEGVLSAAEVAALREVIDRFVERARSVTEHDNAFDLEPSYTREEPRIRRIKTPHAHHALYDMCGDVDSIVPRMVEVPVPLPLPAPKYAGSIYESQRELKNSYLAPSQIAKAMT